MNIYAIAVFKGGYCWKLLKREDIFHWVDTTTKDIKTMDFGVFEEALEYIVHMGSLISLGIDRSGSF